jgi:hypothetical protein
VLFPWFAYALPLASAGLGGVFALKSLSFLCQARACSRWPTAPGSIVRAQVRTARLDDDPGETEFSDFKVLYAYRVKDREFRCTRLYVGNPVLSGSSRSAEALAGRYKTGASVAVYYDPANPAMAMLEPLNLANARLSTLAAVAFGGLGALVLFLMAIAQ